MKLRNPEIRIENTTLCNAHCIMCPREKLTRPLTTMCNGLFAYILEQAVELGATDVTVFGYGEPLMDPGLADKIALATDKGLTTHLTTNGSLLDIEKIHDLLDAGLKNLRFSIHATVPVKYMRVHRVLDWLEVWRNFGNFGKLNELRGRPCKVHLSVIPMHGETVSEIRATWERYVDFLEIWRPHNWAYGRRYRRIRPEKISCGRPFNGPIQVNADGKVMVCCFDFDARMTVGDLNLEPLEAVIKGERFERIREAHRTGRLDGLPCAGCDQLNRESKDILLYSSRDPERRLGLTSTCKMPVEEKNGGIRWDLSTTRACCDSAGEGAPARRQPATR